MSSFIETQLIPNSVKSTPEGTPYSYALAEDKTVGASIKEARMRKGQSQKYLAKVSGITAVQLCRIENDECIPTKNSLKALSPHIGLPYSYLLFQAGYNNISDDLKLYKKNGKELEVDKIIFSIYKADSDLLEFFNNFDTIGTAENVEILKLLLQAMRKEASSCITKNASQDLFNDYFKKVFQALKKFIISSLKPVTG